MIDASLRNALRWILWLVSAVWLAVMINAQILQRDPAEFSFRAPAVEAEMKNCSSEDMKQRYDCKEQALLAHERSMFYGMAGPVTLIFAPPVILWLAFRWLMRRGSVDGDDGEGEIRPPPSIRKWRVR